MNRVISMVDEQLLKLKFFGKTEIKSTLWYNLPIARLNVGNINAT